MAVVANRVSVGRSGKASAAAELAGTPIRMVDVATSYQVLERVGYCLTGSVAELEREDAVVSNRANRTVFEPRDRGTNPGAGREVVSGDAA